MSERSRSKELSRAFARQALSDLHVREILDRPDVKRCHALQSLQMAAEKVCKAHLYADGKIVKETHAVVRKHLSAVAREFGPIRGLSGSRLKMLKHLATEIDLLAPAVKAEGSRLDNVEYPWEDSNQQIIAPIDYAFEQVDNRQIADVVKLLKVAASDYAS